MTSSEEILISSEKAAKRMGYKSARSFMKAANRAGIPRVRLGRNRVMFSPRTLREWVEMKEGK